MLSYNRIILMPMSTAPPAPQPAACLLYTSSMFCRRLEKAGYIAMIKNDRDARFIYVELTESGRALVLGLLGQMGDHTEQDTMSKEDLDQILNGLQCLEKYLRS